MRERRRLCWAASFFLIVAIVCIVTIGGSKLRANYEQFTSEIRTNYERICYMRKVMNYDGCCADEI